MKSQFRQNSESGFTLVELLVTILIIVILSVTMLPLLKPFVTQAQYAAEGVPVIGNIRTKVELFRIEKDYMPGVLVVDGEQKGNNSDLKVKGTDISSANYGRQYLKKVDVSGTAEYHSHVFNSGNEEDLNDVNADASRLASHVWKCISVNYADLTGKRLRPEHIQYTCLNSDGDKYYWVVSCFGDGNGMAKGCGYAVAEFNDPSIQRKFVATFELYKPVGTVQLFIEPVSTSFHTSDPDAVLANGKVEVPDLAMLKDAGSVDNAINDMRAFGWQVN